jgi:hypothetical protein
MRYESSPLSFLALLQAGNTNYLGLGDPVTAASSLSSRLTSLGVTFEGRGKGFPSGISFPSDKVDVIKSCGRVGVVNRGYGCTLSTGSREVPFLEGVAALCNCVVLLLQAKLEQRKAGLLWKGVNSLSERYPLKERG